MGAETFRCRCVWADVRCPNPATQEDGLCDWCGDRTAEQLRSNPKALIHPVTGEVLGLGGGGDTPEAHSDGDRRPSACWFDPERVLLGGGE